MRAVPQRIRKLVDAPVVVFGHTHDPRWQPLRSGGLYVNAGTWLPATRPGPAPQLHPRVHRAARRAPRRPSSSASGATARRQPFDARANLGAGVMTLPGIPIDETNPPAA